MAVVFTGVVVGAGVGAALYIFTKVAMVFAGGALGYFVGLIIIGLYNS